jgi:hypothetical protein
MKEDDAKARVREGVESGRYWLVVVPAQFAHELEPIRAEFYRDHKEDFEILPWAGFLLCAASKRWLSREQFAEHLRRRFFPASEESPTVATFLKTHDCFFHGTPNELPEVLDAWLLSEGDQP